MIRRRLPVRRRRVLFEEPPDDGLVCLRGHLVTPEFARFNAEYHLAGFDDLPKKARDRINYAPTPEAGARPTCDLVRVRENTRRILESLADSLLIASRR